MLWRNGSSPPATCCCLQGLQGDHVPASRHYQGGFGSRLMLKDLMLAFESAEAHGRSQMLPMAHSAAELYKRVVEETGGSDDFASIYKHIYKGN